jgi:acyl carrier protein
MERNIDPEEGDGLADRVIALIVAVVGAPREQIQASSSFEELGIDSLTALSLVAEVENAFAIEVSNADLVELRSVSDVIATIRARAA